jgi:ubiquinone/menaquinone biosynthesis C-methylase UbiE
MYPNEWNKIAEEVNFTLDVNIDRFVSEIPTTSKILDFGCGYDRISKLLFDAGYRNIVVVDSSVKMIERGKQGFPELSLEVDSAGSLHFTDSSFDAVIVCGVFTCITSQEARLSKINDLCRILKPRELLHMVEFCAESSRAFTARIGVPMLRSSTAELRELVCMLHITNEETANTKTIGGNSAISYSVFARKSLDRFSQGDRKKRGAY